MERDIIEALSEWPVTGNIYDETPDPSQYIDNPTSVASFFLRNVGKGRTPTKPKEAKALTESSIEPEVLADIALARWWRKEGKLLFTDLDLPQSNNPNTVISFIARCPAGVDFLEEQVKRLRLKIEDGRKTADVHAALASCCERLQNLSVAKMHWEAAVEKAPEDLSYQWQMAKLQKQIDVRSAQEKVLTKLNVRSRPDRERKLLEPIQVERVSSDDLTFEDFFYKYELTSTPVVITGVVDKMTSEPWTFQHIKEKAGDVSAMMKKMVAKSVEWARLEDCKQMKVSQFINSVLGDSAQPDQMYLFDWSLPLHCPELAKEVTIPKYFAGDFLQRTVAGSLYQDSWPSLFIAPAGLRSELHVDAFGSNFWMALFQGKKRWIFFKKKDQPLLYPRYEHSMDPVFDVDLSAPDLTSHPMLSMAQPIECILQPGELLFVPAGCPHRVENLETSLAISGNFVDLSNFDLVKQELSVNALRESRSADLLQQFNHPDFVSKMSSTVENSPWDQYKTWSPTESDKYDITAETVTERLKAEDKT